MIGNRADHPLGSLAVRLAEKMWGPEIFMERRFEYAPEDKIQANFGRAYSVYDLLRVYWDELRHEKDWGQVLAALHFERTPHALFHTSAKTELPQSSIEALYVHNPRKSILIADIGSDYPSKSRAFYDFIVYFQDRILQEQVRSTEGLSTLNIVKSSGEGTITYNYESDSVSALDDFVFDVLDLRKGGGGR